MADVRLQDLHGLMGEESYRVSPQGLCFHSRSRRRLENRVAFHVENCWAAAEHINIVSRLSQIEEITSQHNGSRDDPTFSMPGRLGEGFSELLPQKF